MDTVGQWPASSDNNFQVCHYPLKHITLCNVYLLPFTESEVCGCARLLLTVLISRFFGCGLPFPAKLEGCRVLDLGSGSGRDCYAFSKLVGQSGHVTGIDMTEELVTAHTSDCLSVGLFRCTVWWFTWSFLRSQHLDSTSSIIKRRLAIRSPMSLLSRVTWRSSLKLAYRMTQWMLYCVFKYQFSFYKIYKWNFKSVTVREKKLWLVPF